MHEWLLELLVSKKIGGEFGLDGVSRAGYEHAQVPQACLNSGKKVIGTTIANMDDYATAMPVAA